MSVVSGVTLFMSVAEDEDGEDGPSILGQQINAWLATQEGTAGTLKHVEAYYGGGKHPQQYVMGGGFNYLNNQALADFVLGLPWYYPDHVVLVIQPEEGETKIYRPEF